MEKLTNNLLKEIYEDEISFKYKPGKFKPTSTHLNTNQTPFFAYDYLNFNIEKYSFNHPDFLLGDYKLYFSQVKKIAKIPLNNLINYHKRSDYFHLNKPNLQMSEILRKILGSEKLQLEDLPTVGQFHLYTPNDGSRKAPRIHFFIGPLTVFYILLYDPYHEIYPVPHLISENTEAA